MTDKRRRAGPFKPTHRVVYPAGEIAVMLVPRLNGGDGVSGPAFTATEWDRGLGYNWELRDGEWLYQGSAPDHLGHWFRVEPYGGGA